MSDTDLERLRRDVNQRASAASTLRGEIGPGCFVLGLDGSNVDEHKQKPCGRLPSRPSSLLQRQGVEGCLDQQRW